MDFSVILAQPSFRALVQENALDRFFADALFPNMLFRGEADPEKWEGNQGDNKTFTGKGLMKPRMRPIYPGKDPVPHDYTFEQWLAQMQKYADSIDTQMPTAMAAAVNKLIEDLKQLGLNAGQTLNRIVRNRMYNAGMSGWTNATANGSSSTALHVARLNGFTRARRPDLSTGSPVQFQPVSTSNPLAITLTTSTAVNVVGFTPDTAGDEVGPGTLTLDAAQSWTSRDAVFAGNRTYIVRVGGGNSIDSLTAGTDILHLADIRSAVARLRSMNVPQHADGTYHLHLDPTNEAQIYADNEFQRLNISKPEGSMYEEFAIGKLLGCTFYRNNENPQPSTVDGSTTDVFSQDDPFGGEVWTGGTASGSEVHRCIVTGGGWLKEYYVDQNILITEAGITGKVEVGAKISNNGIEIDVERIHVVMRSPQDRLQEIVAQTWKFQGDFVVRTDAATGDAAAYKRACVIETTI